MSAFETRPLNPHFGVEVTGINLTDATDSRLFGQIRALFEEHSALLFRGQDISDAQHKQLAELFGPIEDRKADERKKGEKFEVPTVSNVRDDGSITEEMDLHTLNLKSNFLWHSDSTFLPTPALTNILISRVATTEGGATELASTRAAWANMPEDLKAKVRGRGIWHRYSHSRRKISPELAELPMFNKWPDQHWNALWRNPVNGREALYIASHAFKLDGYDEAEGQAIIEDLIDFCTQPQFVYSHNWQVGDVLIWDQRAVLHRGTPWPYEQPRVLSSICSTVTEADAIETMRRSH
ncbi:MULTISPECIES: TauD/TfdA family dioxygenase [unclassified Ruegeria]|uniref:TauD/TfdA dioxygenase family protein n=1 Tax=unclassified Ruegeria TaxID=2625375 RepID=UPI0014888A88|nr:MULTISPECIES: TauD/TfdA family dioxygenase [unclassified Ruegeria]NOD77550.1 TauD/TfdA family dioxygenase [Ruegeria sp. HKCCD4332]NOD89755.1 TauD/TfdA family dioxygenase [Ruegeria sp. HKCCD4318]NOE14799.1 TauD/TfdA family dioxygenase [Ruegeria sp. HKCCD4318-2]NOG11599.1 TauD/TfdA family dioxygenase [Ruegeria sp. HKCCD4315]